MKQFIMLLAAGLFSLAVAAQSEKYMKAMESRVNVLDTVHSFTGWQEQANGFERIGEAEKNQWLPFYYAAYSNVMMGYMVNPGTNGGSGNITQLDQIADKSDAMISKAEALEKDNADIWCVKKMIATLRMSADPMTRWQTYGPQASEALAKAKTLDPANPRISLLEGQDKFYTPEQFGGSKTEAKVLFEDCLKKFGTYQPKSAIHPHWGQSTANYFLGQLNNLK